MSGFTEGENRHHASFFLERLDHIVSEGNPARVIDLFSLDSNWAQFSKEFRKYSAAASTGLEGCLPSISTNPYSPSSGNPCSLPSGIISSVQLDNGIGAIAISARIAAVCPELCALIKAIR